jgi:O-antigen/teichoic acid export membrane protein
MGIIIRQSLKYSVVNYAAVLIGVFSTIFIYPLNKQIYGLFRFLIDTSNLLVPLVLIGTPALSVKFFPIFKGIKHKEGEFIVHLFWISMVGFVGTLLCLIFFKNPIFSYFGNKSESYYLDYLWFIVPFLFANAFFSLTKQITTNYSRIVWPSIFESLIKIVFPLLFMLYFWGYISLDLVIGGVAIFLFLMMALSLAYLYKISKIELRIPKTKTWEIEKNEFYKYAAYFTIGSAGAIIATRIDTFMVGSMIDLNRTGIYSIAALIAVNIGIPVNAVTSISSPIISKAIAENNWGEVESIYKKSSITLLLSGCFLFLLVWTNIDDVFGLMPDNNEMLANKLVVLLLATAKLFDMATGVNDSITAYSGHYKVNFYSILLLAVVNIVGNLILIPQYGILGAAISPMIASIIYNIVKLTYIKWAFNIYPFTIKTFKLVFISIIVYLILILIPNSLNNFFNLTIRSVILFSVFVPAIYFFRISEDVNGIINAFMLRIKEALKI